MGRLSIEDHRYAIIGEWIDRNIARHRIPIPHGEWEGLMREVRAAAAKRNRRVHPSLGDSLLTAAVCSLVAGYQAANIGAGGIQLGVTKVATHSRRVARATASGSITLATSTAMIPFKVSRYLWQVATGQRALIEDTPQSVARSTLSAVFEAEREIGASPIPPELVVLPQGGEQLVGNDGPIERVVLRKNRPSHRLHRRANVARVCGGNIAQLVRVAKAKWSNLHCHDTPAMRSVVASYMRKTAFKDIPSKDLRTTMLANSLALAVEIAFLPNECEVIASRIRTTGAAKSRMAALGERTLMDVIRAALGIVVDTSAPRASH